MEPQETNEENVQESPQQAAAESKNEAASAEATASQSKKQGINIAAAIVTCAAMIAIALVLILHPASSNGNAAPAQQAPTTPTAVPANIATVRPADINHVRGDLNTAQVLIIEYSDSDCPFCEQFHPTLQQVVSDYQGKVAWIYRFFPLSIHPNSHTEAVALQCAGELGGAKAFNSYLDTVINVTLSPDAKSNLVLNTFASQQGLDPAKFAACRADPATSSIIDNSIAESQTIGAQGTPFSIIVNVKTGKQIIVPGAYPLADVKKDIDSLLQ